MAVLLLNFPDHCQKNEHFRSATGIFSRSLRSRYAELKKMINNPIADYYDFIKACFPKGKLSSLTFVYPNFLYRSKRVFNLFLFPDTDGHIPFVQGEKLYFIADIESINSRNVLRIKGMGSIDKRLTSQRDVKASAIKVTYSFDDCNYSEPAVLNEENLLSDEFITKLKENCYPVENKDKASGFLNRQKEYLEFRETYLSLQSSRSVNVSDVEYIKAYQVSRQIYEKDPTLYEPYLIDINGKNSSAASIVISAKLPDSTFYPLVKVTISYKTKENGIEVKDRIHERTVRALLNDNVCLTDAPLSEHDKNMKPVICQLGNRIGYFSFENPDLDPNIEAEKNISVWFEVPNYDSATSEHYKKKLNLCHYLCFDKTPYVTVFSREAQAFHRFAAGQLVNPYLAQILLCPEELPDYQVVAPKSWYRELNALQKESVAKALSSPGLFLLQGPPGTGKTQVIAETVAHLVNSGKKVLIASETHKAIENVFDRLPKLSSILPVRLLTNVSDKNSASLSYSPEKMADNLYENISTSLDNEISNEKKFSKGLKLFPKRLKDLKQTLAKMERNKKDYESLSKKIEAIDSKIQSLQNRIDSYLDKIHAYDKKISLQDDTSEAIEDGELLPLEHTDKSQFDRYQTLLSACFPSDIFNRKIPLKDLVEDIRNLSFDRLESELNREEDEEHSSMLHHPLKETLTSKALEQGMSHIEVLVNNTWTKTREAQQTIIESCQKNKESFLRSQKDLSSKIEETRKDIEKLQKQVLDLESETAYINYKKLENNFRANYKECLDWIGTNISFEADEKSLNSLKELWDNKASNEQADETKHIQYLELAKKISTYLKDPSIKEKDRKSLNKTLLNQANVFGMTCKSANRLLQSQANGLLDHDVDLSKMNIDAVIVDEVSKSGFVDLLISLILGKTVILSGDTRQLSPLYDLAKKAEKDFNPEIFPGVDYETNQKMEELYTSSIFKSLYDSAKDSYKVTLENQYRSHSSIMNTYNLFYSDKLKLGNPDQDKEKRHNIEIFDNHGVPVINERSAIYFVDCPGKEETYQSSTSIYNTQEAKVAAYLADVIAVQYQNSDPLTVPTVGIICTYRAQAKEIKKRLNKNTPSVFMQNPNEPFIVSTVDDFQGDERDVIILSLVRSPLSWSKADISFLMDWRRINVALSRARKLLIVIGNKRYLEKHGIIDELPSLDGKSIDEKVPFFRLLLAKVAEEGRILRANDLLPKGGKQ